jgi:transposase
MHIDIVPNRKSPPAVLLRESFREGKKVRKRTLANLSSLPAEQIDAIRRALKGERLVPVSELFETTRSFHHGHVQAVLTAMRRLGFESLLASRPCRERDIVVALVTAQILEPDSKLATTRWWHTTTLPATLGVAEAREDDFYEALDWLLERQEHIEKKLAQRHLEKGGLVLYDLTSSYFEGKTCPLAHLGHNRDGKKGKLQVNYGLLTDGHGCPVAVSVFDGNTGDPKTLLPQVKRLRDSFGIDRVVLVGDRGMISQKQINALKDLDGIDWITALKSGAISKLVRAGHIQLGLFDQRNLFELSHPDFPGERLVACRNPELGKLRAHKRQSLLDATVKELDKVHAMVVRGTLKGKDKIGVRVGKVINKYKVAKHVRIEISDGTFSFSLDQDSIAQEAVLDGIYVIRTSVPNALLSSADAVRNYKALSQVERAFRSLKTIDLEVRPIRHRLEDRVKAHIFLCMLAQYVVHHMIEAWRSLLFCDEDQAAKKTRDPVAPAHRSAEALHKAYSKTLDDGTAVHSFQTLLKQLSTIVRNVCRMPGSAADASTFEVTTTPTPEQQRALDLLEAIAAV